MLWQSSLSVVCGKFQNPYGEVNIWKAWQRGLPVLRRESGGGAVTHCRGNLNYSMIMPQNNFWDADSFVVPIIRCLQDLGVPATPFPQSGIAVDGLKVSGSAQRIRNGRILHHGTLLFDADLEEVESTLHRSPYITNSRAAKSKPAAITNIRPYLKQDMDLPAFARCLADRLAPGAEAQEAVHTQTVDALLRNKYAAWNWNFGRTPPFSYHHSFDCLGEEITLSYRVVEGRLQNIQITAKGHKMSRLATAFLGQRLEPGNLLHLAREVLSEEQSVLFVSGMFA